MNINITQGDITNPVNTSKINIIVHCVNNHGVMGAGVAAALFMKWPQVRTEYVNWFKHNRPMFDLGEIQLVKCEPHILVCNLIGQKGFGGPENIGGFNIPPVRYEALFEGFCYVREYIGNRVETYALHLPLLGAGLAGGDFSLVMKNFLKVFKDSGIETLFYAYSDKDYKLLETVYNDQYKKGN